METIYKKNCNTSTKKRQSFNSNTHFLEYIFNRGGIVYPAKPSGAPVGKLDGGRYEIRTVEKMRKWAAVRDIQRFVFRPQSSGLIGVDLDEKRGKHGIRELTDTIGNIDHLPYTSTPSGGRHLYFLSDDQNYVSTEIRPGLEIKFRGFITLPGSRRHDGLYNFHGSPHEITRLPLELEKLIPKRNPEPAVKIYSHYKNLQLEKITQILSKQGLDPTPGNRNHYSFQFSRFARKMGHTPEAVYQHLSYLVSNDFPKTELQATIGSAYSRGRK